MRVGAAHLARGGRPRRGRRPHRRHAGVATPTARGWPTRSSPRSPPSRARSDDDGRARDEPTTARRGADRRRRTRSRRSTRADRGAASACRAGPRSICAASSLAPSRRWTVAATSGARPAKRGAEPHRRAARRRSRRGRARSPGRRPSATSSGVFVPDVARQLRAGLGEHPGVADEAGEHGRDADAARPQVLAQALGEAAQAELRRRVDRRAGRARLAGQRRDEDDVAAAALGHALAEQPGEHHRRAQVDVERAVDLLDREVDRSARWPGAPRWRRARRPARPRRPARSTAARSERSHASARPPISAASGSSTSARRPVSTSVRAARGERARDRVARARRSRPSAGRSAPEIHARPVSTGAPADARASGEHRDRRGEAVQERLAADRADLARGEEPGRRRARELLGDRLGVVVAARRTARARGRCRRTPARRPARARRAPRIRTPSASRRSRSALSGVAGVQPHDLARPHVGARRRPGRSPGRRRPARARGSRPARTRACSSRRRSPSAARPATSARSAAGSVSIVSRSLSSAGLPASSRMTLPSAAVIVSSGPIGAAPCDTHGSISTPSSRTPTAPSSTHLARRGTARSRRRPCAPTPARRAPAPPGAASDEEAQDGVGGERRGVGEQDRAARRRRGRACRPARRCPPRPPRPWRGTLAPRRRRGGRPTPRRPCRARPRGRAPITPPARAADELGRARAPRARPPASPRAPPGARRRRTRSRGRTPRRASPSRAVSAASQRARALVGARGEAGADADGHAATTIPPPRSYCPTCRRPPSSRCSGPPGVGKTAVAIALADRLRADGEDPVAVSADALQVYRGLETLTGAATRGRAGSGSSTACCRSCPSTQPFSAGAYARRAHAEIDAPARARAGGRSSSAAPACTCARRSPSSTCARRSPAAVRERRRTRPRRARRAALHAELPRARRGGGRRSSRPTRSASSARSSCSTPATRRPRGAAAVDRRHPPPDAARRPDDGARGAERRGSTSACDAMVAAGRRRGGPRARTPPAPRPTARKALGFEELLAGDVEAMKRSTRRYARRQLTWMRKLPGRAAARRHRPRARATSRPSCTPPRAREA